MHVYELTIILSTKKKTAQKSMFRDFCEGRGHDTRGWESNTRLIAKVSKA